MSDSSDQDEMKVNITALIISLVALLGTVLQLLQQYYATAAGYSNCDESVIGEWHKSKHRKFRWGELRFEVQFESPVIFVCAPTNTKGPVKNEPIHIVDGSIPSLRNTRVLLPKDEKNRVVTKNKQVHTADNERATWVTLLSEMQSMEKDSEQWQLEHMKKGPPHGAEMARFQDRTLSIAVQAKKRSWDSMPSSVNKPYATTAMCHLIEIAAMMGIYWKEFSRSKERYRAEGNGYMLTGNQNPDLGLVFTFQVCGQSHFGENRVIPVDDVKELVFGVVSTIFKEGKDSRRLEIPNEDTRDLGMLLLGSPKEVAETMVQIECNTSTANYFRNPDKKHGHLFPSKSLLRRPALPCARTLGQATADRPVRSPL